MKKIFFTMVVAIFAMASANGQEKKNGLDTIDIQMPRFCCESMTPIIEHCLAYEKGVEAFDVEEEGKYVSVIFNPKKTDMKKIEMALSEVGVETPDFKANPKAIEKLPSCCRATAKGEKASCTSH
ncbi:MAG: hypothetical protein LBL74_03810 [Bacteroidales bacterium]|jgi:hypothetical protein|nr:hypothetical protein [Bacteroidales bacterium]